MATELARKLWTVEEYERLIEVGMLNENHHVELIRGDIVEMTPIGIRHAGCVANIEALFGELINRRTTTLWGQNPILLPTHSLPQPDVALLRGRRGIYSVRRPVPEDIYVVVEVEDSSLNSDRTEKIPLYAQADIQEAWIAIIEEECVEVYKKPIAGRYTEMHTYCNGEDVPMPEGLKGTISVEGIFEKG